MVGFGEQLSFIVLGFSNLWGFQWFLANEVAFLKDENHYP